MFCSLTVKLFEVAFCRMFRVGKQCVTILRKVVHEECSVKAGAVSGERCLTLKSLVVFNRAHLVESVSGILHF